jgi:transposase
MPINKSTNFTGQSFFIGLDVHKKSWSVNIRTLGLQVAQFVQDPNPQLLVRYLEKKFPNGDFYSAYEAGFCGTYIHNSLCHSGIKNIIVHPADLPQTDKQKKNKTDLHDSNAIARYLEAGLLKSIYVMPTDQQQRRALYRLRETQVKEVTRSSNRLRSFINYHNISIPDCFPKVGYIANRFLDLLGKSKSLTTDEGYFSLNHYVDELRYQRAKLLETTKKLRTCVISAYSSQYHSAISVPGIGPITAAALLCEIGDFKRFNDNPDEYTSFLGLRPSERSSGETIQSIRMQPRCNRHLRPLLIESAWVAIRTSPVFLAYYKKHVIKNPKKAIVKVAKKLAMIVRGVITKQTAFNPNYGF